MASTTHAPHLTTDSFESLVVRSGRPAAVDFYADWCAPCRVLAPHVDALAAEAPAGGGVFKVNVDENPDLAARYGVRSIPTVIVFRDGAEARRLVGPAPAQLVREVREALAG